MPSLTILFSIGQYVISLLVGIGFYYINTQQIDKKAKKQAIDLVFTYIINFIIYIWLAKIIVFLPLFFTDPFAVLPYPSDSRMFYIASVFTLIHGFIAKKRNKLQGQIFIDAIIPIFFMSSFIYEFMDVVFNQYKQSWSTFILTSILLICYVFIKNIKPGLLVGIWAFIQCLFGFYFSYTTLFGYTLSAYYFIVILMITVIIMWIRRSR